MVALVSPETVRAWLRVNELVDVLPNVMLWLARLLPCAVMPVTDAKDWVVKPVPVTVRLEVPDTETVAVSPTAPRLMLSNPAVSLALTASSTRLSSSWSVSSRRPRHNRWSDRAHFPALVIHRLPS